MNKNRYRVIFSQARGMFIAVAEIVKSRTKTAGQSHSIGEIEIEDVTGASSITYKKLNPVNFAVVSLLGAAIYTLPMATIAESQIVADRSAPSSQQATILNSSNGLTQVNIQTPSAGGVSRNTYTQFDVGQEGAILNNARNNTQTQLGGWVQGNPWLAKGEAKVILNEVNSSNPSQLKGYLEVAGKQAQVVIANPSGLICDGCGVINADRFTLTTGQAVMHQGYLDSFRVREGQVTIEGKGLNGSLTPYTDIYTRALNVNAGLYANELKTVLGQNDINVQDPNSAKITATTSTTSSPTPSFALDVGKLGGMYAGKIYLVGTEKGLGVRNAGSLNATTGQMRLNANGDLTNTGNMIANKDQLQLNAENIKNTGNISSATSQVRVDSQNLDNSGLISSADELYLDQQKTLTNAGVLNAARIVLDANSLKNSGSIEQTGAQSLDLISGSISNTGGRIGLAKNSATSGDTGVNNGGSAGETSGSGSTAVKPNNPAQDGGSVEIAKDSSTTNVPKAYDKGYIHVKEQLNNDQGAIIARGVIDLDTNNILANQEGKLNLGHIKVQGEKFNNDQGQLTVQQADILSTILSNQSGQIAVNKSLKVQSTSANNNKGTIQAVEQVDINITDSLNNSEGKIASGQQLSIQAGQVNNQSGLLYSEQQDIGLDVQQALDNASGIIQAKTQLNLNSQNLNNNLGQILAENIQQEHGSVDNTLGSIVAKQNLISSAIQFDNNQGQIQANNIEFEHKQLNNSGSIYADQNLNIIGQNLQNTGSLSAGQEIQLKSETLQHQQSGLIAAGLDRQGKLGTTGNLKIIADQVELHGQSFAGENLNVQSQNHIDASKGQLQSKNIELNSQLGNISTHSAQVIAEHLSLNSHDVINNQQGTLSAKDLKLNANSLDNSQGHILHTGTDQLDLNFSQILNNQSGEIRSNATQVNLNTTSLNNTAGQLIHAGTGQLDIQVDQLQGNQGKILSNGQLQLQAGILDLSQGVTSAEHIILKANQLNHQQGQLIQRGKQSPLTLAIQQQLNNQLGFIQSQTVLNMDTGALNNQGGTLSTAQGQDLNLKVKGLLDNSHSGKIYVGNNANIQAGSIDNHTQGQINVQQNLKLNSQLQVNNQTGQIAANADVQIQSQGIDNSEGQISSVQGRLELDAGTGLLSNQSGSLQSAKDIEIKAERLHSQSGLINAQGSIQAQIQQEIDNNAGQIIANQSVQLNSQGLNNNAGQIGSVESTLKVDAGQGVISNQQGKLQSKQDLSLNAQGIDNQSGLIATQGHLELQQHWLKNNKGQVISGESLNLTGQDLNNQGGLLQSGRDLSFKLIGKLDNSQSGQLISGGHTQIDAQQLENGQQGLINAQGSLSIKTQQDVNNNAGIIAANKFVEIQSQGLDNSQGQLGSVKEQVTINTGKGALLNQSGTLQSTGDLNVQSTGLNNNKGTLNSLGKVDLVSDGDLSNDGGQIASNGQLEITANDLSNQSGLIQTGEKSNLNLKLGGALSNQTGQIHSGADQQITAQSVDNSAQGQITAQGQLNIQSQAEINNQTGKLIANGLLQVKGEGLNNTQGQIGSLQDQVLVLAGQGALTNQLGTIQAKKDLSVTAQSIDNQSGQMNSQGQLQLNSQQAINNLEGLIAADLGLKLNSQGLNNNRGQIGSAQGDVDLNAGNGLLSNQAGVVLSGKALKLNAGQVDNSNKGQINSQADLAISTVKEINNQSGVIASNQQLSLKSQGLNNNAGQIGSIHAGVVVDSGSGVVDNNSGVIQAQNDIQLKAQELKSHLGKISSEKSIELSIDQGIDNSAGQIVANDAVTIQSQGLNNDQGQIASIKAQLSINAGTGLLSNQSGSLQSAKDIEIKAERLHSQSGLINAQGSIQAQIQQEIDNNAGQIIANQSVQLNSQGLNNNAGQIGSVESTLKVDAGQGVISNQQGKLQSKQDLSLNAQGIDNQSGLIATQGHLELQQHWLKNNKGQVISGESLNLTGQDLNNQGGLLQSGRDLSFKLIGKLDNSQSGQLISGSHTQIDAQQLENSQQGLINAQGSLSIRTQQGVNNNAGIIAANKFVEIQSQGLDNSQGQLGSVKEQVTINTGKGALLNQSGTLQSTGDLNVQSTGLNNNKGTLNSLGKVDLVSDGDLSNDGGQIASNGQLEITANDLSNQSGLIQTGEKSNLNLKLGGALSNQTGQIHSGADQQITAQSVDNSAQGQITAQGQLNIQSQAEINNQTGKLIANGLLQVKGEGLNNTQGQIGSLQDQVILQAGQGALTNQSGTIQAKKDLSVTAQSIDNQSGQMNSQGQLQLNSQQAINNLEGLIAADLGLKLNSQGLNNNRGQIGSAQGDVDLNAGNGLLSNQAGVVLSGKALKLNADQVDNSNKGQINSQADLEISTVKEINNQSGVIASNQQLSLKSQGLNNNAGQIGSIHAGVVVDSGSGVVDNNSGVIQAQNDIQLKAQELNSHLGKISSEKTIELNIDQAIDNSAGQIVANDAIAIQSQGLNNDQGQIASIKAQLSINAGTGLLSNQSGSLQSAKDIEIKAERLHSQSGLINAQGSIQAQIQQEIDNNAGQIIANQSVQLNSQGLNNNAGQIGSVESTLKVDAGQGVISNQQGKLQSKQDLSLNAQGIDNQSGLIATQGHLELQQHWLKNNKGQVISGESLNLTGQDLNNQGGLLQSGRDLSFKLIGKLDNSQSGQLISGSHTQIDAQQLENSQQGLINAQGSLSIRTQQDVNNNAGIIAANKFVEIQSQGLDNSQGQLGSVKEQVTINTGKGALLNQSGTLQSTGDLNVQSTGLNNNKGTLNSLGKVDLVSDGDLSNDGGQIASNGQLEITANDLSNQSGLIQTGEKSNLNLKLSGALSNQTGQIHSGADQQITAQSVDNSAQGQITAQGQLNIQSQAEINNQTGKLIANGLLQVKGEGLNNTQGQIGSLQDQVILQAGQGALTNQSGTIQAKKDLSVTAQSIDNQSGQMNSQGQLQLNSQQAINNLEGLIAADLGLKLNSQGLNNNRGQIGSAQGDVDLNAGNGLLSNQAGVVLSGKALTLNAGQVDNSNKGQINSQADLAISTVKDINNQSGVIASNQQLSLKSQGLNNNAGQIGSIHAGVVVDSGSGVVDNNSGVIQAQNDIQLKAQQLNSHLGKISSEKSIELSIDQGIDNSAGQIVANDAVTIQSQGLNNDQGQIASIKAQLSINAGTGLLSNQSGSLQSAKDIEIKAERLHSQSGLINAQGSIQAQIQQEIDNNAGQIIANQSVQLNSQGLNNNAGQIGSVESTLKVDAGQGIISNQQGKLQSKQDLSLNAQGIDNQSGLIATQGHLELQQHWLKNNKGQVISGESLNLTGQDLNNQGGLLQSGRDLSFKLIGKLDNSQSGQLISGGHTQIDAQQLENGQQGLISTQGDLRITNVQDINNAAGIMVAKQNINLSSQGLNNNKGQIGTEQGDLKIQTGQKGLDNLTGQIQSAKTLNISSSGLTNSGVISALNTLNIDSQGDIHNDGGQIASNGQLEITANDLSNQSGLIQTGEKSNLNLKLGGALSNQTGQIHSGADQQITAQSVDNSAQGQMTAQGQLNIQSQAEINNQTGKLIANGLLQVKGEGLNNTQGQIGSLQDQVILQAGQGALTNQLGTIQAKKDLSVTAQSIDNQSGQMNSQGQLQLNSQQAINNLEGLIAADLGLNLNSQGLNNNRGQIGSAQGDVDLNAGNGLLSNQAGVVLSGKALKLNAGQVDNSNKGQINSQADLAISTVKEINNQSGVIASNQQLSLKSQGLNNNAGQIGSVQGQIQLDAGQLRLENQQGLIQAGQGINIVANGVNNVQGQINSKNLLQLNSQGQLLDNSQGTLSSESIKIDSGRLNNNQGLIQAQQTIQIDTQNQDLVNTNSGQQGGILSQGDIQLSNVKTLNNSQGYLASAKELGIQVNQVLNQQGTILAGKQLNIWGTGQNQLLDNQSGQLLSMGGMTLNIDRINNNGKLKPSDADSHIMAVGDLNITTQQLDNQNTLTTSPTDTSIQGIDANNLNITTNILNNQTGAIRSSGNQNLNIRQILNNQSGQISSEKQLIIVGDQLEINNLKGQILSGTGLNLTAKSLSGNGKVLSLGDAQVNLKESYTHGIGAQLQANQNLSLITQGNIINYGTINSGNRLDINAVNIGNMVDAKIESHETRLTAQNELNNTGLINGDYTRLQANTLNNQGTGRIYGTTLAINANTLNNQPNSAGVAPVIASRGDMYLGVQVLNNLANTADYASQSLIFSAGNLYLGGGLDANDKTVGQALVINNESATIESLGNMRLSAKQINNINKNFKTQMVEIERKDNLEKFYKGDWKTFDGKLIANKIYNEDWAKYTYNQVTSETRVMESAPGQIKAGGALNLDGAQVLNDKSQILAGGVLSNLGGSIASGNPDDSKGIRKIVASGTQTLSEIKYVRSGIRKKKKRVNVDSKFTNTQTETFDLAVSQALGNQKFNQNKIVTTLVSNNQSGDNTQSSQTQQTNLNGLKDTNNSTQVKQAQNSQGENLTVKQAENISNSTQSQTGQQNQPSLQSKDLDLNVSGSQVTVSKVEQANAQNLTTGQASDITNSIQTQKGQGAQVSLQSKDLDVNASGVNVNVLQAEQANGKNLTTGRTAALSNTTHTQTGQLNQPSQQSKDLNANLLDENVSLSKAGQVNDQNQQLTDKKQVDNSSQVNDLQQNSSSLQSKDSNISVGQTSQKQGDTAGQAQANNFTQQANAPSETDESTQYEIRTLNSSELKVPNSALYRVNANSKAGYLVETDPSFTNYKTWLSSDYMLDALGLDPALQQKRLADGLYEQRLVQDQIANLTGYRFLEGYANDDEQYKALMNNGVSFAKLYGLRPGIALTAAQTAQLTSDIVWLVEQTVILPNGTKTQALVPQVYVKARVGDLKGDGTLLSGDAIQFKLDGDLINGATIAGRQAVQITADNVQNLNGRIHGNQVAIETKKDLNNIGGQISAKESMALKVGGNLNIESTTLSTESKIGGFSSSQTSIDRVAGIYVGSGSQKKLDPSQTTLLIDVAGNTNLKAAQINNSNGTTILNTLGNLDIGTVTTSQTEQLKIDSKNGYQYKKQQDIGSQINSEGSLVLNGQNINIQGSALNSEQGITQVTAKDFIHIEEGRKISDMESQWFNKSRGLLGSKQQSSYIHDKSDEALVSTITGKSVILNANNIDIRGSQIVSNDLTQIQAKNNINIIAAENYYLNESQEIKKKSGFTASLSGGVASVGYGKSSLKTEQKNQSTALVQSQIISTQGNTNILAGKDLTSEAAILGAGKDLNLQGVNVNLNAGYESNTLHSLIQSKNSGVSVGLTYSPMAAVVSTYKKNAGSDQFSDSAVGQLMSRAEALNKAAQAAITPVVVTAGSHKSSQTSDYNNTQAVVTQAIAKGNLNIIATDGSINSQGAQLAAEGNALLHAKDSINLDYVTDHEAQTANSKQSGFSIDNRDKSAPAGVYNNKDKGQGNVDKVTGTQLSVGGKTTLQTEKGDINILGSSVASQGDVKINAANDVNIKSAQSSQSQSQSNSNKGIGSAQISDTEQFYGYMKGKNQSNSQSIEQQRSQVGSLEGNVNIQAGNNYNQQVADIVANKDINITAKQISVLDDYNTGSSDSSSKDLKVGVFKRISSPILDLLGSADKAAKGNAADDRTQALQGLAAGAQAYQSYSDIKGGSVAKAEAGIGFSTSKNQQSNSYVTSQQNQISAGGNVNLTSTAGDIHLQNTQVKAKETISLDSAKNILLESGQSQEKAQGKNSNAGLSVGVGASVGAQTGAYIYAEAGYGKGSNQLDRNTHTQTTLEANKVSLTSKGDTTLAGAKATANRIDADVGGKLSIISQQDQVEQKIDQSGAGARVQASLGTAWQASGNLSNSSANASSNSVNQQAGLFAGDGGYHVKADQVDLKGGAIVSTSKKENNDLTANRLTFSDINNKSSYDATSVSLSGGTSFNKDKPSGDGKASNPANNENWRNATSFSPSLPQHESDKDSSVTRSTLSEGNITIGGQATTTTALGIHSDASTAHRSVDTLPNLQEILDKQKTVADATSTIAAASRTYSQNQQKQAEAEKKNTEQTAIAELQTKGGEDWNKYQNSDNEAQKQELLKNNSLSYKQASETAQDWGMGGDKSRAVNAVAMAVTGALGGQTDLQVAANALAPYAANIIGKELGHGEDKNKAAQLAAHAILGAALAYVNGGNPAAGGSAAVASEAAADYLTNQYKDKKEYQDVNGEFQPNLLPEDVKTQIRDLTAAIGAVVGGTVGDSAFNAQLSGVVGQNAVENNALITESPDGKSRHYTPEDNKFNLLQYLVATGQLTLDQVPDSIFEDMANRGYTSLTDGDKAPNNSSEEEKYRQNFIEGIKDEQIISEQKFLELMNKNPEMWAEVKEAIETKQFWEGVKEPVFKYVLPGLQLGGGVVQTIGAGAIDVVGCATIVACGVAVGGSSLLIINGLDDIRTGWNNFGGLPEGQTVSSTLTSLGVSEGTAGWVKLGVGGASIGAEAIAINQGLKATTNTFDNVTNTSNQPVISEKVLPGKTKELISGSDKALLNGEVVYPQIYKELYHGADAKSLNLPDNLSSEQLASYIQKNGLNARGTNIELMSHQAGNRDTAFRGTTTSVISQGGDAGAAYWAGPNGIVVELKNVKGYDLDALQSTSSKGIGISGMVQKNTLGGELEISVPAQIDPSQINRIGIVKTTPNGKTYVDFDWGE